MMGAVAVCLPNGQDIKNIFFDFNFISVFFLSAAYAAVCIGTDDAHCLGEYSY